MSTALPPPAALAWMTTDIRAYQARMSDLIARLQQLSRDSQDGAGPGCPGATGGDLMAVFGHLVDRLQAEDDRLRQVMNDLDGASASGRRPTGR